jgi:hypothetical protein
MDTLARYLELIVDPTFDDFAANRGSVRHAFLACVTIFHAIDRAAEEKGQRAAHLRQLWCKESVEFKLVDVIAHHFKHVKKQRRENPAVASGAAYWTCTRLQPGRRRDGSPESLLRHPGCGTICAPEGRDNAPCAAGTNCATVAARLLVGASENGPVIGDVVAESLCTAKPHARPTPGGSRRTSIAGLSSRSPR